MASGLFSGKAGRIAAMQNAYTAQNTQQQIAALLNTAQGQATNTLGAAQAQQLNSLQQGYNTARQDYGRAGALYEPYTTQGLEAWNLQGDIAGLHGAEGYNRAVGAFQTSPGYQWQVDQAADQVSRAAGANGMLMSGNTLTGIQDRASNLANQEFGTFDARVRALSDRGYQATGAQADLAGQQGQLAYNLGGAQSGVYGDTAARQAGIYSNTAGQQASALTNLSGQLIGANNQNAKAKEDAEANRTSLLAGLLGLGSKAAAFPMSGGGSLGGNLFSKWIG